MIIFLNRRCAVGCPSCSAGALPSNTRELSPDWLSLFFKKLDEIEEISHSGYIVWTGGEPFLSPDSLFRGLELASKAGYHSEILTGGTWFWSNRALLKLAGNFPRVSLRISLDAEHQQKIGIDTIIELIGEALDLGLEVNFTLREIPGQSLSVQYYMEKIKEALPGFYSENITRSRWIHTIPHIPVNGVGTGSCGKKSPGKYKYKKYKKPCTMIFRDLVIGEDGLLYPCCGFFSLPDELKKSLSIGDPVHESWENLEKRQIEYPVFRVLKEEGPFGLCREYGIDLSVLGDGPFETPCHFCLLFFNHRKELFL